MADLRLQVLFDTVDKLTKPLKNVTRGGAATAKSLKETQSQLKALKTQQRDISSFRQLHQQLRDNSQELAKKQARVRELAAELKSAEKPTRKLSTEFKRAQREAAAFKRDLGQQREKLHGLRSSLKDAGISTRNLTDHDRRLRGEKEKLNTTLASQKKHLADIAQQQKRMAKAGQIRHAGMMTAGHGAAAVYGGQRALRGLGGLMGSGMDFEATMSRVQSLARLDRGSEELQALRMQARMLGASTSFTATQAAQGQAYLAMAGFDPTAIAQSMPGLLDMAKAGGMEIGRTADIASNILGGFDLGSDQMGKVADILTKTFTTSNTDLEMLGKTMEYIGPVARTAGMSLEETAAMAGLLGNVGIQGQKAGTTMRSMLLRLSAPTGGAAKAMKELGLNVRDVQGNVRSLPKVLEEVAKATEKMGNGERLEYLKKIFGEEPAAGMSELIQQAGAGGILEHLSVIDDHQGESARAAKVISDNLRGDLATLNSAAEDFQIELFEGQSGALRQLTQELTAAVRAASAWVKANPELAAGIAKWAGVGAVGITVLGGLAIGIGSLMMLSQPLLMAISGITLAFKLLAAAGMFNPVVLAITALAAAGYMVWQNWDGIVGGLTILWDQVKSGALSTWEYLQGLPAKFQELGVNLIKSLSAGITNSVRWVKDAITGVGSSTIGWFKDKLGIRSPSRVFAALGDDTMAGLAMGIDRGQARPLAAISAMGRSLAAGGALATTLATPGAYAIDDRPALTPRSAPTVIQGDTVTIHITAPAGTDSQELAALIRDTLDERDRQKAERGRSALYDIE